MRGRKKVPKSGPNFDLITEDCPKVRTRFKKEVRPSIQAWLVVIGNRHLRQLLHMRRAPGPGRTKYTEAAIRDQELRCEILAELVEAVGQHWNRLEYGEACADVVYLSGLGNSPPPVQPDREDGYLDPKEN